MVAFTHFPHAVKQQQPGMGGHSVNNWLDNVVVSHEADNGTAGGFLHLDHSDAPRVQEYTYHEMNIIVEGEMTISDSEGNVVEARVGDVLYFPKGSVITFNSNSRGVGFFCGQHREGDV